MQAAAGLVLRDVDLATNPIHVLDLAAFFPVALLGYALAPLVLTAMILIDPGRDTRAPPSARVRDGFICRRDGPWKQSLSARGAFGLADGKVDGFVVGEPFAPSERVRV